MKTKIINMSLKMQDPKGYFIPKGVTEVCKIEIIDQVATFRFMNSNVTKRFVLFEQEACNKQDKKCSTIYYDRVQKAITKYEGKTKEEIKELLLYQFKQMGLSK